MHQDLRTDAWHRSQPWVSAFQSVRVIETEVCPNLLRHDMVLHRAVDPESERASRDGTKSPTIRRHSVEHKTKVVPARLLPLRTLLTGGVCHPHIAQAPLPWRCERAKTRR